MQVFKKTRDDDDSFNELLEKINMVITVLGPYNNSIDLTKIKSMRHNFDMKVNDFFREGRKLNIGVIGRVKSGKSSFLDTFLFAGKDILPKAVTPKTATLTRIEYSKENRIEVEYYSDSEWSIMKEKARAFANHSENIVAREILTMADERNLNPYEYTKKKTETISFNSYDSLMSRLNQYVGENGKYTPVVKAVTLYVNIPEIEEISIVDTPGISDPIQSRTDKTRKFIELCDVVFFMSKANGFMDKNDMDLFMEKIPAKGVKKFVLVCSRFDDAIRDFIWSVNSLKEAEELLKDKLLKHTQDVLKGYKKDNNSYKLEVLKQCKKPVFVSAIAYNMSKKDISEYTEYEKKLYKDLNYHNDCTKEELKRISNMPQIRKIFNEVLEKKEELLETKSKEFVTNAKEELYIKIIDIKEDAQKKIKEFEQKEKEEVVDKQNIINDKINSVVAKVDEIFEEIYASMKVQKSGALRDLRSGNRIYSQLTQKEGTITNQTIKNVPTSKWYEAWKWGEMTKKIQSIDTKYTYLDAKEALNNIKKYAQDAVTSMENVFKNSINSQLIKFSLYNDLMDDFEDNIPYLKLLIEKLINGIKYPSVSIDVNRYTEYFEKNYQGEITDSKEQKKINSDLNEIIGELFEDFNLVFLDELEKFKKEIDNLKEEFIKDILKEINKEYSELSQEYARMESQIDIYKEIIVKIEKLL